MPKSRIRKKSKSKRGRLPQDPIGENLLAGARVDFGDFILSTPDLAPDYAPVIQVLKDLLATPLPANLEVDPLAKLRTADREIEALVEEVDDWLRTGNHVRVSTRITDHIIGLQGGMVQSSHYVDFDDIPTDWASRAARIIADLRSQLDQLIFWLAVRSSAGELTEEESQALSFPIQDSSFKRPLTHERLAKRFPSFRADTLSVLLEAQPGPSTEGLREHQSTIWLLNRLNNLDKHREGAVLGQGRTTYRGPGSRAFAEGELLILADDILGQPCPDGCAYDAVILYGRRGSEQFLNDDGTVSPMVPLCRFLRSAFALVGEVTVALLGSEGVLEQWDAEE